MFVEIFGIIPQYRQLPFELPPDPPLPPLDPPGAAWFTVIPIGLLVGVEGELLSVATKTIVKDPVWLELGFQEKSPVVGLKAAPVGRPVVERVMVPPVFAEVAVIVKLIQVPSDTV
jgi:hypothetical protein